MIERARAAGIGRVLNPGIDLQTSREALRLSDSFPEVFAAIGIHPNEARTWKEDAVDTIRALAAHPKVVAIGEIGLDYYRDRTPKDLQRKVFQAQLALAAELDLPVIIHNRQAGSEILPILEDWVDQLHQSGSPIANRPGVLHSYSEDDEFAFRALTAGFFLGFTGPVTFKNAGDLQAVVQKISPDRILIETDAPFLAPDPFRGQRNEPAYVTYIAEKISELRNIELNSFINKTSSNAARLFCW